MYGILFRVTRGNAHVITNVIGAGGREQAKRQAQSWLGGDPDYYIVEPLTARDDRIHLDITIQV